MIYKMQKYEKIINDYCFNPVVITKRELILNSEYKYQITNEKRFRLY
jgi:hypothetical protein